MLLNHFCSFPQERKESNNSVGKNEHYLMNLSAQLYRLTIIIQLVPTFIFQIFTRSLKSEGNLYALVTIQNFCYLISAIPLLFINWLNPLEPTGNLSEVQLKNDMFSETG